MLIFEKRVLSPQETITKAVADAREWQLAKYTERTVQASIPATEPKQNITEATYLVYTDGAWKEEELMAGLGWTFKRLIIPESESNATFEGAVVEESVSSPLMAEALALHMALFIAREKGIPKTM
ncbi:unnamed protein product [Arabis nemorensis]|uniref:RNase H type-1 domain-containing protein n=1 Tax=Arabis nemorensis TaxID=586526 RepID=A0A565CA51_9BRAS|nr:unnamed protein product [Arabis nemorensis]